MFVSEVQACMDTYRMVPQGATIIVAVSGGPDSMALLSVLQHLRRTYSASLIVAHVNHQLRGEEARHDADFVSQQAARYGLPFYQTEVNVKSYQRASGLSPQHAARCLRYEFLNTLRKTVNASHIALGHTADDQAETVLLRLLRGSGPAGLGGMSPTRPPFIRPLIRMSRQAILTYLREGGVPWIIDSSNTHRTYLRNRIRIGLLPTLERFNPRLRKHLHELADMLQADNIVLEQQTDRLLKRVVQWQPGDRAIIHCEPYCLAPLALQRRVVRRLLDVLSTAAVATTFQHVESIRQLILDGRVGRRLIVPGPVMVERHLKTVFLWRTQPTSASGQMLHLTVPGEVTIDGLNMRLTADLLDAPPAFDRITPQAAYLDLSRTQLPLIVRFFQPGDRFYPLGAPGRKKLKAFFIDGKVPRAVRPHIPLVLSGTEVAWVVGYRIAEPFKVSAQTETILRLCCHTIEERLT